jgi:hypothetical protein
MTFHLDSLALAGQQQAGAVVMQWHDAVDVADDVGMVVDLGVEALTAGVAFEETHAWLRWSGIIRHCLRGVHPIQRKLDCCDSLRVWHKGSRRRSSWHPKNGCFKKEWSVT